jgi:hypothetical protein
MASKARKLGGVAKGPGKGPLTAPYPAAEIDEAVRLLTQALKPHKRSLDSIYLFSLGRSLPSLRKITDQIATAYKGKTPLAVNALIDWLRQVEGAATGNPGTKTTGSAGSATLFTQTLGLREKMHVVLQLPDSQMSGRFGGRFARWIMTDWGGVDRKKQELHGELFAWAKRWRSPEKVRGYQKAARWSKVLAFCRPQEAAIFDARVVYSLNWYLRKAKKAKRFPTLPSENSMMNVLDHSAFVASERMGSEEFTRAVFDDIHQRETGTRVKSQIRKRIEGNDYVVSKDDAYPYYLKIMARVAKGLFDNDDWGITKTEMMLFGLATTVVSREVCQALHGANVRPAPQA